VLGRLLLAIDMEPEYRVLVRRSTRFQYLKGLNIGLSRSQIDALGTPMYRFAASYIALGCVTMHARLLH
jgi:hypothetical protein